MGLGADEIATEYNLTLAEIYAALAYYYDNPQEMAVQESKMHFGLLNFHDDAWGSTEWLIATKILHR